MDMTVSRAAGGTAAPGLGPGLGLVQPTKSPEAESETPPRIQPTKPISFSNGVLKRHAPPQVVYKECLKNHAATIGGHALDGCGEFMPSPTANSADPTSLKCAACGCHRNFHRREPEDNLVNSHTNATHVIEYQPHHRHHPLPPPPSAVANRAESPPPISSTFAPHMLLALSTGVATANNNDGVTPLVANGAHHHHHNNHQQQQQFQQTSRKRFRTKFSQEQKEKMHEFAEKVGWKMQKTNEDMVNGFCNEIGVERGVFKVWMHNNKNTFGKRSTATATAASGSGDNNNNGGLHHPSNTHDDDDNNGDLNGNGNNSNSSISINDQSHHHIHHHHHHQQQQQHFLNGKSNAPTNNASSSSS